MKSNILCFRNIHKPCVILFYFQCCEVCNSPAYEIWNHLANVFVCHHVPHMHMLTLHTIHFKLCYLNNLPKKPLGKSIPPQHWSHIPCSFFTEKAAKWHSWLRKEKPNKLKQSYWSWNIPLQVDLSPIHLHSGRIPNKDVGIRHHKQSSWRRGGWSSLSGSCTRTLRHVLWKDPGWLTDRLFFLQKLNCPGLSSRAGYNEYKHRFPQCPPVMESPPADIESQCLAVCG